MRRNSKKLTGNIATVKNKYLNINKDGVHMVYIRKDNGNTVDVNVITSLEDKINNSSTYRKKAIKRVKSGYIYPVPFKNTFFDHWSGVELEKITNINKKHLHLKYDRNFTNKDKMVISILGNKKRT